MRWDSHTKRMNESKVLKKVFESLMRRLTGVRRVGRPRKRDR